MVDLLCNNSSECCSVSVLKCDVCFPEFLISHSGTSEHLYTLSLLEAFGLSDEKVMNEVVYVKESGTELKYSAERRENIHQTDQLKMFVTNMNEISTTRFPKRQSTQDDSKEEECPQRAAQERPE